MSATLTLSIGAIAGDFTNTGTMSGADITFTGAIGGDFSNSGEMSCNGL